MMRISPHVKFHRETREALTFYQSVFGGELELRTFADFGAPSAEADAELIMHGVLHADWGEIIASDTRGHTSQIQRSGTTLWLSGSDVLQIRSYWTRLSHGATVIRTLDVAPWGDAYGRLTDRFGVDWEINIEHSGEVYRRH